MLKDVLQNQIAPVARAEIERRLGLRGEANSRDVARALGLSLRTMQRQLAVEGTSFSILVDTVRREQVLALIAEPKIPLSQISQSVGFRYPSTLVRAFRRWTGRTPRQEVSDG